MSKRDRLVRHRACWLVLFGLLGCSKQADSGRSPVADGGSNARDAEAPLDGASATASSPDASTGSCMPRSTGCACNADKPCDSALVCDRSTALCRAPKTSCSDVGCTAHQRCEARAGADATCLSGQCEPGYRWQASNQTCTKDSTATCAGSTSIAPMCDALNRPCVDSPTGASCGDCAQGQKLFGSTCVAIKRCADLGCSALHRGCSEATSTQDAVCTSCESGFAEMDGACTPTTVVSSCGAGKGKWQGSCVSCKASRTCGHEGEKREVLSTFGPGTPCICETEDGYYPNDDGDAEPCDKDGDGWVRIGAEKALTADPGRPELAVERANTRCALRTIGKVIVHDDLKRESSVSLDSPIPLYESKRNDEGAATGYLSRPSAVNGFTKACSVDEPDLNDNKTPDVEEQQSDNSNRYARFSYFIEQHRGWFEPDANSSSPGTYFIEEISRTAVQPNAYSFPRYPDGAGPYHAFCTRRADTQYARSAQTSKAGADFFNLSGEAHLTHHSQFKCIKLVEQSNYDLEQLSPTSAPTVLYRAADGWRRKGEAAPLSWTLSKCAPVGNTPSSKPGPNPSYPQVHCTLENSPASGSTYWAAVDYQHYPYAQPQNYVRGCINECEIKKPTCPYECDTNTTNFGEGTCQQCGNGFAECDANTANGCESLATVAHCGDCQTVCSYAAGHGQPVCNSSGSTASCGVQCDADYRLCSGACVPCKTPANGGNALCKPGVQMCEFTCPSGLTLCGDACVDVNSDPNHCGACGYKVVGASQPVGHPARRTCVAGKPSPGWVPIATAGAPTDAFHIVLGWTGKRILYAKEDTDARAYDPATDTWSPLKLPPGPLTFRSHSAYGAFISVPDRGALFFWRGDWDGTPGTPAAYLFDDSGASPQWQEITGTGAPTPRDDATLVYDGDGVHVLFGWKDSPSAASSDVGRYSFEGRSWTKSPMPTIATCTNKNTGVEEMRNAMSAVWAGGRVLAVGGQGSGGAACGGLSVLRFDPAKTNTSTYGWDVTAPPGDAWVDCPDPGFLSVGEVAVVTGGHSSRRSCSSGTPCMVSSSALVSASASPLTIASPPAPPATAYHFLTYTGRSVISWGGGQITNENLQVGPLFNVGSIGVLSGSTITWAELPLAGAPRARWDLGLRNGHNVANNQSLWTGREAIIWGGSEPPDYLANGAKYQPPVGCVCPASANLPPGVVSNCAEVGPVPPAYASCTP